MKERRRKESADSGGRTRRADRADSARAIQSWLTTFNLRWAEHLKGNDQRSSAGA